LHALALVSFAAALVLAQSSAAPDPAPGLVQLVAADQKQGEWVDYTQRFRDVNNHWARYQGSIYAAVSGVKIDGCRIRFDATVVDHYDGVTGKNLTGEQQDSSEYSLSFTLTQALSDRLEIVELPPFELRRTTHPICDRKKSCALTWLRITDNRGMAKTVVTNRSLVFNGTVTEGVIPFSSPETAATAAQQLKSLSNQQCP
jgi:uncharacterized protein YjeT (DUF2065 family)